MSYGDFRRVLYQGDRKPPPPPENPLRAVALLLLLVSVAVGLAWMAIRPFLS